MMVKNKLSQIYHLLFKTFGPQHWWPGDTPLEIVVGAILTQNTAWVNVEKAITNLKQGGLLRVQGSGYGVQGKNRRLSTPPLLRWRAGVDRRQKKRNSSYYLKKLYRIPLPDLARLIRPAGYFNIKAKRLKNFVRWVVGRYGSLEKMFQTPTQKLRRELLGVNGIGPETADSILLYGGDKPVFVVDAYTKRILTRHKLAREDDDYHDIQSLFARNLKKSVPLYNEYHALFVKTGKDLCKKKKPLCQKCPLEGV